MKFPWQSKTLGLDLGSRSLKGVVLTKKSGDICLADLVYHDYRHQPDLGTGANSEQELVNAVIEARGFKNSSVAGCIDDKEVQLAHLSFPEMSEADLALAIRHKIEAKTGIESQDLCVDYIIAGKVPGASGMETLVRVYFTKMNVVREKAASLQKANLKPLSIESCLQATIEALRFNEYINKNDSCVVADIGESHTSVGLVIGGHLAQLNTLRMGSGDINDSLVSSFQCTYQESEAMKLAYRLEKSDPGDAENMNRVIEDGYYKIILGIHDTVAYYKAAFKDQLIVNLLLTGGGAQKEGLANLMEQSLGIPTLVPNALRKIQIFSEKEHENLSTLAGHLHPAIGLALRGL